MARVLYVRSGRWTCTTAVVRLRGRPIVNSAARRIRSVRRRRRGCSLPATPRAQVRIDCRTASPANRVPRRHGHWAATAGWTIFLLDRRARLTFFPPDAYPPPPAAVVPEHRTAPRTARYRSARTSRSPSPPRAPYHLTIGLLWAGNCGRGVEGGKNRNFDGGRKTTRSPAPPRSRVGRKFLRLWKREKICQQKPQTLLSAASAPRPLYTWISVAVGNIAHTRITRGPRRTSHTLSSSLAHFTHYFLFFTSFFSNIRVFFLKILRVRVYKRTLYTYNSTCGDYTYHHIYEPDARTLVMTLLLLWIIA